MAVIATVTSSAVEGTVAVAKTPHRIGSVTYPQRAKDGNNNVYEVTDDNGNPKMLTADHEYGVRPVISDVVNSEEVVPTRTYRFYMPDSWRNDRNDNYDGKSLDSCCAGLYLWSCSYNSSDYKGDNSNAWPGFRILERDPNCPNIYVCEVPEDAGQIIFNNTVDAGMEYTNRDYGYNCQIDNMATEYADTEDDRYGFHKTVRELNPETGENEDYEISEDHPLTMDGMILVPNQLDVTINEFSKKMAFRSEWFYYYGNGKYGLEKTLAEAEEADGVYQNGDFPSSLQISDAHVYNYLNNDPTYTVYCSANPDELKVESGDSSLVSVSPVSAVTADDKGISTLYKSKVTVTGLAYGNVDLVFEQTTVDGEGAEKKAIRTCKIHNEYQRPLVSISNKSVYIGKTVKLNPTIRYAESVIYSTSNSKVATIDTKGVIKGVAAGTAKITVKAKAGTALNTQTITVTVKKYANPMTVKAKAAAASSKKNTSLTVSKYATVKGAKGKVTYKKASGDKKVTVASNGKMTVKKGLKKGKTVSVNVKITAAGDKTYAASTKTITVKIKIK